MRNHPCVGRALSWAFLRAYMRSFNAGRRRTPRELVPGLQCLRNTPGLCKATARRMRRIAVKDLGYAAEAAFAQMRRQVREQSECKVDVVMDTIMGEGEWPEQPRPDRSLVISGIALGGVSLVDALVARIAGCQGPQADRRQQLARARLNHRPCTSRIEQFCSQRHCEDLIRAQACVHVSAARLEPGFGRIDGVLARGASF